LRRFCNIPCVSFLLVLGTSLLSSGIQAQTAVEDRISQPIEQASVAPIAGSVHPLARAAMDEGLVDNSKTLTGMTINFRRTAAQEAGLQALLQAQQTPGSPNYHQWLTPAQFGQQFGMSSADLAKVSDWLQQEGFTVSSVAQSSNAILFSGTVATAERAFQTQIHSYSLNGEKHFANATNISIPAAMAGAVSSVRGLDDFRPKARVQFARKSASATNAHFTSGISGDHFIAPGDFALIYDVNPLYTAGDTGKGLTIAVMGQVDIVPADITDFRGAAGLPVNDPTVVTVPGSTPETVAADEAGGFNDLVETDLDLEWSGGVATAASIILVNSADVFTSLQYAIQNQINGITIPIISQSYGACETNIPTANQTTYESWLAQANSQGQTVLLAAGDTGAADCDNANPPETVATQGLAVDYPGSSVYVTDLGGSEFTGDGSAQSPQTGSGQYWSANGSNDVLTSVKSYIPEMVWNDTTYAIQPSVGGGLSGGGGGASQLWNKPSWQTGVPGIPADGKRDVPDVSLNGSPYHDPYLYCTQIQTVGGGGAWSSSCQATSFRISDPGQSDDGGLTAAGGTSFAAPSFAGLLAVIEQKMNKPLGLGNINPALYSLAANATTYASAFHDITTGNNEVPCSTGSPNCPTSGNLVIGYAAGTGYDQASGLGSLDGNNLATAFATATFSISTTTKLVVAPAAPAVGVAVTLTATVAAASGTTVPGGSVTFTIDGTSQPAATLAAGVASITTNFATGGAHTVQAVYSGATGFFVSSSPVTTVNVTASGVAKTSTTLTASPTTVAIDGALQLTAAVTSATAGTLAGNVTFTIGSTTVGTAAITPGASGAGSATLSVASATTALGFAVGSNTVVATYGGDANYASSSGSAAVTVNNPGITIQATNVTISASPGNTGTSTITLTSTGGYAGTANVQATGSVVVNAAFPNGQTGTVALSSGGTGTTTLTITTTSANGNIQKSPAGSRLSGRRIAAAGGTAAGCILLLLIPGIRRKRWPVALIMLVFLSVGAGLGCGGGGGGAAPAGNYTITVTAADSSNTNITASTTFTLTLK
jgi:Pro-kumamolisin, activation domain/Bacterial Ig-like domain (group 3)